MKQVLSIQDLSCVGRCSLTVALPVISAMGCQCSVLPTAVLSSHTGFPDPAVVSLTGNIPDFFRQWKQLGLNFDCVTTGYLSDPEQVQAITPLLRHFREEGSLIVADPAMGDHGKLYRRLDQRHVEQMRLLCHEAHVLLPNLTEAALLTGLPYCPSPTDSQLRQLAQALLELGVDAVIITGVRPGADTVGFFGMHRQNGEFTYATEAVPRQFHGTGDLFTAVFAGALAKGTGLRDSAALAADFVRRCVAHTQTVTPMGVNFEAQLPWLCAQSLPGNI